MTRRRTYTREFKESAIELYRSRSGKNTIPEIAGELGIHPENLRRWLTKNDKGEKSNIKIFPGQGNPRDVSTTSRNVTCLRSVEMSHWLGYLSVFLVLYFC